MLQTVNIQNETIKLQNWLIQLQRFRGYKSLPPSLINQIMSHFNNFFQVNKQVVIKDENSYMEMLPKTLKKALVVGYLYDDVMSEFRGFFCPEVHHKTQLLMKLCLGLYPRFFKKTLYNTTQDTEGLIYKEGDEVQEIYFILSGEVSAGYQLIQTDPTIEKKFHLTHKLNRRDVIGDYYVFHNKASSFWYMSTSDVHAFSLSKSFLFGQVFNKQPELLKSFQDRAKS